MKRWHLFVLEFLGKAAKDWYVKRKAKQEAEQDAKSVPQIDKTPEDVV